MFIVTEYAALIFVMTYTYSVLTGATGTVVFGLICVM